MTNTRRVGRRTIKVSNLDKVFWPVSGFTKGDLIDYYDAVSGVMVPHVRNRLMTLERYPDGIQGERFFSKGIPKYFPDWIARKKVPKSGGTVTHVVCNEAGTLVYLANQGAITQHVSLSRVKDIRVPDQMVIDLDPPEDGFKVARRTALTLKEMLESVGLVPYAKLTGSKGVHVMTPITPKLRFDKVREIALRLSEALVARHPKELTLEIKKAERAGRTLVDFMRNSYAQTVVAPYSVRARPGAPVAVPIEWEELEDKKLGPRSFSIVDVPKRVELQGDPWKGWGRKARSLGAAAKKIESLQAESP
jgi:bifunctional non-homologous end joining protein LigD